jgi:hypothetical protein
MFVHPWQFRQAMQSLGSRELQPNEIVFSAPFEHVVQEAMEKSHPDGEWSCSHQQISLKRGSTDASTLADHASQDGVSSQFTGSMSDSEDSNNCNPCNSSSTSDFQMAYF